MAADDAAWQKRMWRQRQRRQGTDGLWSRLDDLVPDARLAVSRHGRHTSQALKSGRTLTELLEATVTKTRRLIGLGACTTKKISPGVLQQTSATQGIAPGALAQAYTTEAGAPGASEQAFTTQAGAGLIAIGLTSGKIAHQSPSFQDLTRWVPAEARGNIRVSLEARDGDAFHSFCQSVAKDAGELCGETFLDREKVVGWSITVRFFTRAPGPPGLSNPEWLLMVRAVKLTLVGVQPGKSPAAGTRLPFFGQRTIPEAIGVFTADLSGGTPAQWTLQVAHVRYLLDLGVASGIYDLDVGNVKPLELIANLFNFEFSKATASALDIARRSATWLSRKALNMAAQWSMTLHQDDTVSICSIMFFTLFGGLSTRVFHDFIGGNVAFSHGGLDFLFFVADPEQPLDRNLRATLVRIASSSPETGEVDVHRPFVFSMTWSSGQFKAYCKTLAFDAVGKKVVSVDGVSELLEKLQVSPGGGLLSDGSVTICVGNPDV